MELLVNNAMLIPLSPVISYSSATGYYLGEDHEAVKIKLARRYKCMRSECVRHAGRHVTLHRREWDSRESENAKFCSIVVTKGAAFPAMLSSIHGSLAVRTILFISNQQGRPPGIRIAGALASSYDGYRL